MFFVKLGKRIKANFGVKSAIFIGVFAVLLAADLVTKYCAELYGWNFTIIPGFIEVVNVVHNDGASLSIGSGTSWAQPLFITITFIMVPVFIVAVLLLPERAALLKFCIYIALAGAIGNLVDRLSYGYVRDFIFMDWGFIDYVCNLADVWLVAGLVIAIIDMLFFNDWAVFPLTKRARAAQKEHEEQKSSATVQPEGQAIAQPEEQAQPILEDSEGQATVPEDSEGHPEEPEGQPAHESSVQPPEEGGGDGDE